MLGWKCLICLRLVSVFVERKLFVLKLLILVFCIKWVLFVI